MVERNCVVCGDVFDANSHNQKTCNEICRKHLERQRAQERKDSGRQYFSNLKYRMNNKKELKENKCCVCDVVFYSKLTSKACSQECRNEIKRRQARKFREDFPDIVRYREKKYREDRYTPCIKNCVICGVDFKADRGAKTCSDNCSHILRLNTQRTNNKGKKKNIDQRSRQLVDYYNNTDRHVRNQLKQQLGFTPPPDLVEEATALRLLRRATKKAGE